MIYLRQKYKEKPQIWGPVESVQRSLAINSERIGIDYADIALAMPMWGPGNQQSYDKMRLVGANYGAVFTSNCLYFNGSSSLYFNNSAANESLNLTKQFSILQVIKSLVAQSGAVIQLLSKYSYQLCFSHINEDFKGACALYSDGWHNSDGPNIMQTI